MVVCVVGCGPLVAIPGDEGSTTDPPQDDDEEDDDDPSTTSTSTSTGFPSTTASPSTSGPATLTAGPASFTTGTVEDCVDLELVGGPVGSGLTAGSTVGATDDFSFCETGNGGGDYVISWTAPAAALYHFTLAGSDYDTVLGIFPPECGGIEHVCNDDCFDVASSVQYQAEDGEQIYIVIDGFGGSQGNFVLNIGVGANVCGSSGTTTGATEEGGDFISGGE
jgi:hypothetical protein